MSKTTPMQERKYGAIRLYNSGKISLQDMKAMFRITAVVAEDEYLSGGNAKDILGTRDRFRKIERLTQTRNAAVQEKLLQLKTKPRLSRTRAEEVSQFATGFNTGIPANFNRYGILIAKNKRVNPSRPGSSKGRIAKPTVKGFKKFNRDFDKMERGLLKILRSGNDSTIRKALKGVKDKVKVSVSRGS